MREHAFFRVAAAHRALRAIFRDRRATIRV
jgi:hypothetical protein